MTRARGLSLAVVGLAALVWALPLRLGFYADRVITDIPVYREVHEAIAAGGVPYRDFDVEYPPLAVALFWVAGAIPGDYGVAFSVLMLACLCATALGAMAIARAIGLDRRREAAAGIAVALSPLLLGNLMETRFDLALAALLAWTLWAAAAGRFRLAWGLLAAATLLKLVPLALVPALLVWQRHRAGLRPALRGLAGSLAIVAAVVAPFAILSPGGTWNQVQYHLDRPLQIESLGSAYLLGLHALADIDVTVESSFGSQGLAGTGPRVIAAIATAVLAGLVVAIAWTLWAGLRRARPPADARLFVAASAATIAALLVGGKVLSPQFLVWLLPVGFVIAGRYGPAAFGLTGLSMLLTLAYFPHRYWDLVDLQTLPIALLVLRDTALIALLAACWPRPGIAGQPLRLLREDPAAGRRAMAARYLTD